MAVYRYGPVRRERKAGQPFGFVTVRPPGTVVDYLRTVVPMKGVWIKHQRFLATQQLGLPIKNFLYSN